MYRKHNGYFGLIQNFSPLNHFCQLQHVWLFSTICWPVFLHLKFCVKNMRRVIVVCSARGNTRSSVNSKLASRPFSKDTCTPGGIVHEIKAVFFAVSKRVFKMTTIFVILVVRILNSCSLACMEQCFSFMLIRRSDSLLINNKYPDIFNTILECKYKYVR